MEHSLKRPFVRTDEAGHGDAYIPVISARGRLRRERTESSGQLGTLHLQNQAKQKQKLNYGQTRKDTVNIKTGEMVGPGRYNVQIIHIRHQHRALHFLMEKGPLP